MRNRWHPKASRSVLTTSLLTSLVGVLAGSLLFCSSCSKQDDGKAASSQAQTIRIGWQVAWATQGQIAMALQKTNALELMGLKGDFKSFTYGAPLSEAALAGQLDVAFVGDQPAVSLLARTKDWCIAARLMDFRVAIVVPTDSPIKTVADLKGKTLGIPFGASTHRVALEMLKEAGLEPGKDVNLINIDITEQADVVKAGGGKAWPKVDAFASWDHHIALYEKQGLARILNSGTALGVVMMSRNFAQKRPDEAARFLAAYKLAYYFYATHQEETDKWFAEAAGGKFDLAILKTVADVEPNTKARTIGDIKVDIGEKEISILQDANDFALKQQLIKSGSAIKDTIVSAPELSGEQMVRTNPSLVQKLQALVGTK